MKPKSQKKKGNKMSKRKKIKQFKRKYNEWQRGANKRKLENRKSTSININTDKESKKMVKRSQRRKS